MPVEKMPEGMPDAWEQDTNHACRRFHEEELVDEMRSSEVIGQVESIRRRREKREQRHSRHDIRGIRNEGKQGAMRPFFKMSEATPGKLAYVKYLGFWHAILITETYPDRNVVKAVHFAWPGIFSRRVISEDEFTVNLGKEELWEFYIPDDRRVSPEEAVRRARARVGQKGFNMFTNRSSHVVKECVVRA